MRQLLSLFVLSVFNLFLGSTASAQLLAVVVEEFDPATLNPDWSTLPESQGLTTYRVYAEMAGANDAVLELTSQLVVSSPGVNENCLETFITTTTSWYNDVVVGATMGVNINSGLFGFFPSLAGDSWLTIGSASSTEPEGGSVFSLGYDLASSFNSANGTNFFGFDGSVYSTPGSPNTLPLGPNNRVLLGQLTTDGAIAFGINVSVQIGGVPGTPFHIYTHGNCAVPGNQAQGITYVPAADLGCLYTQEGSIVYACTDPLACNYNPDATLSSPVCDYDGCDGCTDETACNYWDGAIFDDGSCCFDNCLNLSIVENLPVSYFELYDATGDLLVTVYNGQCYDDCANGNIPAEVDVNSACFQWLSAEIPSCCVSAGTWADECQSFYEECVAGGDNILVNCDLYTGSPAPQVLCLPDGDYTIIYFGLDWEIWNDDFSFDSEGTESGQGFNIDTVLAGCTDQDACNYNPDAEVDNGSCIYVELFAIEGSTFIVDGFTQSFTYPGMEGSSFEWTVGDGLELSEGQGSSTITVISTGLGESSVCVTETLADGCLGSQVCLDVEVVLSVGELNADLPKLYPNPAVNTVRIDPGNRLWDIIIIRDAHGREVGTHSFPWSRLLDISYLAAGRYHLELRSAEEVAVLPLLITR